MQKKVLKTAMNSRREPSELKVLKQTQKSSTFKFTAVHGPSQHEHSNIRKDSTFTFTIVASRTSV